METSTRTFLEEKDLGVGSVDAVEIGMNVVHTERNKDLQRESDNGLLRLLPDSLRGDLTEKQKKYLREVRSVVLNESPMSKLKRRLDELGRSARDELSEEDTKPVFAAIAVAKSSSKYWRDNLNEWRQAVIDALPEPDSTVLRRSQNGISPAESSKRTGACGPDEKKEIVGVITTEVDGEEHTTFVYTCVTQDDETVAGGAGDIAYADVVGAVGGAIAGSLSPDPASTVTVSGITAISSSGEEATCEIAEEFDWECP